MAKRRLLWQLFPSYLVVIVLTVTAVTWYMARSMKELYLAETAQNLRARALLLQDRLNNSDFTSNPAKVDSLCKKLGKDSDTRFTVILPSGLVIGDSDQDPNTMENHADRPEIKVALSRTAGDLHPVQQHASRSYDVFRVAGC